MFSRIGKWFFRLSGRALGIVGLTTIIPAALIGTQVSDPSFLPSIDAGARVVDISWIVRN